mgnify:CR=1 FL=1
MNDKEQAYIEKNSINVLKSDSIRYPKAITQARSQSPTIFHLGDNFNFDNGVSVVGTRSCTELGGIMAEKIGRSLAKNNYSVVSGLAKGIDTHAHIGCLDGNGICIGVLAWFDNSHPRENKPLLDKIIENSGCLLSEHIFAPEKFPKYEFLKRDEIMAIISQAIVVIETKPKGGAMYTAKYARKKNIPIIAVKPQTNDYEIKSGFETLVKMNAIISDDDQQIIDILKKLKKKTRSLDDF